MGCDSEPMDELLMVADHRLGGSSRTFADGSEYAAVGIELGNVEEASAGAVSASERRDNRRESYD